MKTTKTFFLLFFFILLYIGCSNNPKTNLPLVEINGKNLAVLDPMKLDQINNIKLSQIAENLHLVVLDTRPDCMLSNPTFYIGDKYILAQMTSGVYQFSSTGEYIRKLVNNGKGPGEMPSPFPHYNLIEDEDVLLAVTRDHIYQYQLSSGKFLGIKGKPDIEPREQLSTVRYVKDSLILFSYFNVGTPDNDLSGDMLGCGIKLQSLKGKLLWQKKFNYNSWVIHPIRKIGILGGSNISILSTNNLDEYILQINDHDTVYKINTSTYLLEPSLLRHSENQKKDGFPIDRVFLHCFIENKEFASVNGFQLMSFEYVTKITGDWNYNVDIYYILYDDKNKQAFKIGTFENDYLGFIHNTNEGREGLDNLPYLINPLGKLFEKYDAFKFLELAKNALNNPGLEKEVRERLLQVTKNLNENSNPVLVIGDLKKKIDL